MKLPAAVLSDAVIERIFALLDTDGGGEVGMDELRDFLVRRRPAARRAAPRRSRRRAGRQWPARAANVRRRHRDPNGGGLANECDTRDSIVRPIVSARSARDCAFRSVGSASSPPSSLPRRRAALSRGARAAPR